MHAENLFWSADGKNYKYTNLLKDINNSLKVSVFLKSKNTYTFFKDILLCLSENIDFTVLDSDFSDQEIRNLVDSAEIQNYVKVNPNLTSYNSLINSVKNSSSRISIFTSGTTGQPKKVVHKISAFLRSVKEGDSYKSNIWGFAYNPSHMAGLQVFFQAIINQNFMINLFGETKENIVKNIQEYKITNISATPTFYRMLLPIENQSNVERISIGGEKVSSRLINNIKLAFPKAKINNIYASTEAGAIFASAGDFFIVKESDLNNIKIIDNKLYVHKNLVGENVALIDDWYETGDEVELISDSPMKLRIVGRINEMINVGGYKVNPEEVEEEILKHEAISNCIVYSKKNSILGNILTVDIKKNECSEITVKELRLFLKDKLQDFKIPRVINFVENISINRVGKVSRK